jgi:hypothetical protein
MSSPLPSSTGARIGLAAVVLFAPGGFVLGAALAAKWWRDRNSAEGPSRE